jgi:predicted O-methyltransferase YrrM
MRERISQWVDRGADRLRVALDARERRRFSEAPLCRTVLAPPDEYVRLWTEAQQKAYDEVDRYEASLGVAIDPAWFHQLALLTQVAIKRSEICYQHGRLLYAAVADYARARPGEALTIVETGTARGFSALCMARALADVGSAGRIVSFDVLPHETPILWNCIRDADGPRTRAVLLQEYASLIDRYLVFVQGDTRREMSRMSLARVHVASLDSVHTYDHVMAEFTWLRDRQRTGDVLFFDDYTPGAYPGVVRAVDEICRDHGYAAHVVTANPQRQYVIARKH